MPMIFFSMYIGDKKRKLNTPASELEDYLAEPLEELKNREAFYNTGGSASHCTPPWPKWPRMCWHVQQVALQVKDNSLCLGILRRRKGIGSVLKHWKRWCFSVTDKRTNSLNKKKLNEN